MKLSVWCTKCIALKWDIVRNSFHICLKLISPYSTTATTLLEGPFRKCVIIHCYLSTMKSLVALHNISPTKHCTGANLYHMLYTILQTKIKEKMSHYQYPLIYKNICIYDNLIAMILNFMYSIQLNFWDKFSLNRPTGPIQT